MFPHYDYCCRDWDDVGSGECTCRWEGCRYRVLYNDLEEVVEFWGLGDDRWYKLYRVSYPESHHTG